MAETCPHISVIVPVFNTGGFLRPCLDSIMDQTLDDLEIILVDDGSDDALTLELLDEYASRDSRIRLIRKANGGQSSARNAGLYEAAGTYVAFVDHDDVLNTHMYEALSVATDRGAVDVVECRFEPLQNESLGKIDVNRKPSVAGRSVRIEQEKDFLVNHLHIWNRLYRREFLLKNQLRFDDLLWEEDVLFSFKVLILARSVVWIDEVFYFHIEHGTNTTHKLGPKIFHAFKAHDLMFEFLKEKKCLDMFENQWQARVLKDVLFSLNAVSASSEKDFFMEAHRRLKDVPLKHYKAYYSSSKKKLLGFVQKGDFEKYKLYRAFREKRKTMVKNLFRIRWRRQERSLTILGFKFVK